MKKYIKRFIAHVRRFNKHNNRYSVNGVYEEGFYTEEIDFLRFLKRKYGVDAKIEIRLNKIYKNSPKVS